MRKLTTLLLATAAAATTAAGCGSETQIVDFTNGDPREQGSGKENATKADHWNAGNNPDRFQVELNYVLDELPKAGVSEHTPWPATYWPTYEDGINVRWQGKQVLSPAEKYDQAFNGWEPPADFMSKAPYSSENCKDKGWDQSYYSDLGPAASYVSHSKGNAKAHDGIDNDGDGLTDECDDRDGVETWFGLCHAWAPASLLEKEPRRAVVHNGVRFEVSDIKALLIMQYDRPKAYMIGGRCNDKEVKRDEHGRITDADCRDTNAGTWHVVMANFLGLMQRPIAEDRTYDYEVWNQPVLEWKVNEMADVTEQEAMDLLDVPAGTAKYPYNDKAVRWVKVNATSFYITESQPETKPLTDAIAEYTRSDTYNYILEISADGKVHGGEWIGASRTDHPDFLWLPTGTRGGNPSMDTDLVRTLLEKSLQPEGTDEDSTGDLLIFENGFAFDILDNDPAGISSTIGVDANLTVSELEVELNIEHPYIGDLTVVLRKDGRESILHKQSGGSADNLRKTFQVKDMMGVAAAGNWELWVKDGADSDKGRLVSWKLKLHASGGTDDVTPAGGTFTVDAAPALETVNNGTVENTLSVTERQVITGLKVILQLEHTYVGALKVELKNGAVTRVLHNAEGGSASSIDTIYDVPEFNGAVTEGDWTLVVTDTDGMSDSGKVSFWSLEFVY
ncbi:MAG: subtilisin-like proprotein convertase family protein [Myxococcota bacterium]|jgi:subtilisin-like proprotein convertase family protein